MRKILDIVTDQDVRCSCNQLDLLRFWLGNLYTKNPAAFVEASSRIFTASARLTQIIYANANIYRGAYQNTTEEIRATWDIVEDLLWFLNKIGIKDDTTSKAIEEIYEKGELYKNHPVYYEMERYFGRL